MKTTIHQILKSTFGYDTFREPQEEIINHVMEGKDALVIMPTGGGKSICYQIPALATEGITIVISPLIALMNDQVINLQEVGVEAATIHSNVPQDQMQEIERKLNNGETKILYLSPEKINSEMMQRYLSTLNIGLIAIDEAHCVSVWGNDFRPDYTQLAKLRKVFPKSAFIALTATADPATQDDISKQLELREPRKFLSSFERKNITTHSHPAQKRLDKIAHILREHTEDSGIIYCLSRKDTEKVATNLNMMGLNAKHYHAGMDAESRYRVQREFQNDDIKIICATVAFGMGIDKPNIRFVIHYSMPKNMEAYYQEIGRAGRDGEESVAHLFASWGDFLMLKRFVDSSEGKQEFKRVQYEKLERMWEFASTCDCRTNGILSYFGEYRTEGCGHCDNCLNPPLKKDGSINAQKVLSAIYRTGQSIGLELVIDILRGSHKAEIRNRGFDQIKTFGAGREIDRLTWKNYIIQMINKGIVGIDYSRGSCLTWTPLSTPVLKGEKKIKLADFVPSEKKTKTKKKPILNLNIDESLLGRLKAWRLSQARERSVPAYVILSNKVIESISSEKPKDKMELLQINGIGDAKLTMYGEDILRIVGEE
ncbi:MAG: ATP-dependent DNA helicase RecQ [Saprospiraceae bacterium]|jgi:ATP-dependent DNA helicase RecQ